METAPISRLLQSQRFFQIIGKIQDSSDGNLELENLVGCQSVAVRGPSLKRAVAIGPGKRKVVAAGK